MKTKTEIRAMMTLNGYAEIDEDEFNSLYGEGECEYCINEDTDIYFKPAEEFPKTIQGNGGYKFKVYKNGDLDILDICGKTLCNIHDSLDQLYEAVELSKKQRN